MGFLVNETAANAARILAAKHHTEPSRAVTP
jgi:hypothetical protein